MYNTINIYHHTTYIDHMTSPRQIEQHILVSRCSAERSDRQIEHPKHNSVVPLSVSQVVSSKLGLTRVLSFSRIRE